MDPGEGRGRRVMTPLEGNMAGASKPVDVSTKRQRIAELARQSPEMGFTSLAYFIDIDWLHQAYQQTRKDGAAGVDGQTGEDYAADLMGNLQSLLDRAKTGTYRHRPCDESYPQGRVGYRDQAAGDTDLRRQGPSTGGGHGPGSDLRTGLPGLLVWLPPWPLGAQGAGALWRQTMNMGGGWILDVDIRKFFDTIDHGHLRDFLKRRVRDGVLLRLIGKWLNAGVLEDGCVTHPEEGSPQGGVVSPLLSNLFLHYVLDEWFAREVQPRLKGRSFLIRYADDFVMGFSHEEDARRVLAVLPKRFAKYGLTIHPEKTRLVPFERPERVPTRPDASRREPPGTFDLLGFTHFWSRSLRGNWVVKRKTARSRFSRGLKSLSDWCRQNRHLPSGGSTPYTVPEADRPLRLLRDHGQLGCPVPVSEACGRHLEAMALPATPGGSHPLG